MQYLLGLRELGHDVFYLEDCGEGSWVYNWETEQVTTELEYPTEYVHECLARIGFGTRWIYRAGNRSAGMSIDAFAEVCSQADLMIVRGSPISVWRDEYSWPRRRIFIDSDPAFTQISLANGNRELVSTVERCEHLFTIGQRMDLPDCSIPSAGRKWLKTRAPISLAHWPWADDGEATHFSSILQWKSYRAVTYEGVSYGNKDKEFPKFAHLPRLTKQPLRLALTGALPEPLALLGWDTVPGWVASRTPDSYRTFIQQSRAEFGVAKHGYVVTQGGWFSDRSVCYLASGRPVLVQDTGLIDWLPVGEGLLTFHGVDDAIAGIEAINANYTRHRRAARAVAEQYFAAERVLRPLLEQAQA